MNIPKGYKQIKKGIIKEGDKVWSVHQSQFMPVYFSIGNSIKNNYIIRKSHSHPNTTVFI
jgi:hypothetical protein